MSSQNISQKWNVVWGFLGDCSGVVIGVFSLFFVPLSQTFAITNYSDLWSNKEIISLVAVNSFTLFIFMLLFIIELRREIWLIDHLDYSKRYSSVHLTTYKDRYPDIFAKLNDINMKYFTIYKGAKYMLFVNAIVSTVILIFYYYYNYQTITSLFTNFWFCYSKITKGLSLAKESLDNSVGNSYYNTQSLSFNRIDPNFKVHDSTSNSAGLDEISAHKIDQLTLEHEESETHM